MRGSRTRAATVTLALVVLTTACAGRTPPPSGDALPTSGGRIAVEYWASCRARCSVDIVTEQGHVVERFSARWSKAITVAPGTAVSMTLTPDTERDVVTFARIRVDGEVAATAPRRTFVPGQPVHVSAFTER